MQTKLKRLGLRSHQSSNFKPSLGNTFYNTRYALGHVEEPLFMPLWRKRDDLNKLGGPTGTPWLFS